MPRGLLDSLTKIGVNLNYAPVVDLNTNPESRTIGRLDRSFSADQDVVVRNASEEITSALASFGTADAHPRRPLVALRGEALPRRGHWVRRQNDHGGRHRLAIPPV
ncbi:glycoside hydrolase family 3 N-terminal domain-containing protein [Micromonospora sp. NPDC048830]|uniref:glycoside hydrolase family 3 N-terminal domain-containing protein n=1 Tax=Micromonospora sp. NPDC048830 TaxID=3364257 RepID=UPI00371E06C8